MVLVVQRAVLGSVRQIRLVLRGELVPIRLEFGHARVTAGLTAVPEELANGADGKLGRRCADLVSHGGTSLH